MELHIMLKNAWNLSQTQRKSNLQWGRKTEKKGTLPFHKCHGVDPKDPLNKPILMIISISSMT